MEKKTTRFIDKIDFFSTPPPSIKCTLINRSVELADEFKLLSVH